MHTLAARRYETWVLAALLALASRVSRLHAVLQARLLERLESLEVELTALKDFQENSAAHEQKVVLP